MFEAVAGILDSHSRFSSAFRQRLNLLIVLLVVILMTTSCGMPAQAAASQNKANSLNLYGSLPPATVNQPYDAVLAVSGGTSPFYFSVKTGAPA